MDVIAGGIPYSACESDASLCGGSDSQAETTHYSEQIKQAYNKGIAYLARREYSAKELEQRLLQKEFSFSVVEQTLKKLSDDGYQSDERFTEMYIRSRVSAGDGPFKIKISLREKGICESLALAIMDTQEIDWREQAKLLKNKRFGPVCESPEALAKQMRYLKNKGYYQDDIKAVIQLAIC